MNDGEARYTYVTIASYWLIAAGIIALVLMGVVMVQFKLPLTTSFALYQLHKSIDITVLFLVLLRILWRAIHAAPRCRPRWRTAGDWRRGSCTRCSTY